MGQSFGLWDIPRLLSQELAGESDTFFVKFLALENFEKYVGAGGGFKLVLSHLKVLAQSG